MAIEVYSADARARIDAAVRWVERNGARLVARAAGGPGRATAAPFAAIATEDIEHAAFGDAKLAGATGWDSTWAENDDRELTAYNPGPKVWTGALLLIGSAAIGGAAEGEGHKLVILRAWSATRIRGLAAAQINPGATGSIGTLVTIDGHYAPAGGTAPVYLPTAHVTVKSGKVTWAELRYRPEGSRWEIYSADCDGT